MKLSRLTPLLAALCVAVPASAQITGKVTLDGEAPEPQQLNMAADPKCAAVHPNPVLDESITVGAGNELANVVVSLKAPEGKELKGAAPKEAAVIDQVGCMYVPHVIGIVVGQEVVVKNSDPIPHNVHSLAIDNDPFNIGQPQKGQENKVGNKFKVAERLVIKCDIHPWMTVHVNAFEHPYFAVTSDKGTFSIDGKGLEDGKYTLEIWHEKLATEPITQEIEIKGGKATVDEIKIPAAAANAAAGDEADVKLAAAEVKPCCEVKNKAQAIAAAAAAAAK
jgi:hypothetical protein